MPKKIFFLLLSLLITTKTFADVTSPVTTITKNPTNPNGNESWYKNPVEVTITATDLESGIKNIFYKINDNNWQQKDFYQTLNLAPNPSFEYISDDWKITPNDGYLVALQDYTVFKFGNISKKLISSGIGWHALHHIDNFSVVEPYSTITLSSWIKTENIAQTAYFKIYLVSLDSQNNIVKSYIGQSNEVSGTNDWVKITKSVMVNDPNTLGVFMEIGMEGTGVLWVDGIGINNSATQEQATIFLSKDGQNTLQFYGVDQEGNIENTKILNLKIDQTPPGNWGQLSIVNEPGNQDYILMVETNVEDLTSGISNQTKYFQYKPETDYGTYQNIIDCSSNWQSNNWAQLQVSPSTSGATSARLKTWKINFCDNDWSKCKAVRFKAIDVAGNEVTKEYCINGPWIKTSGGGKIRANYGINMTTESPESNSDGIVESGNSVIEFFSTGTNYKAKNTAPLENRSYDSLWNLTSNQTEIYDLNTNSGVFYINGSYTINNVPNQLNSTVFTQVIFINGDLTINKDIVIDKNSSLLFIVKGDVKIGKNVQKVHSAIITDKNLYTAYNNDTNENGSPLELKGIFNADKFILQRVFRLNTVPTENFIYEPKYLIKMREFFSKSQIEWVQS